MKQSMVKLFVILAFFSLILPAVSAQNLVDIELWEGPAVTEAGPPPADWIGYKIIREKLGINLKIVLLPGSSSDQDTKINLAAAANKLPDIFQVNKDAWSKLARAGLLAPVDELLPKMPIRTKGHYSDPIRTKIVTYNKKMYGLPEPGALERVEGLVIRKDWLTKLGLKEPVTSAEFMAVAKAFTEQDPDGNGKKDTYGFGAWVESPDLKEAGLGRRFDPLLGAWGFSGLWNLSNPANPVLNVRHPDYQAALQFIADLHKAGLIDPDWPTLKKDEFRARWKQGKFGIMREQFAALATVANYKDFDANFPAGEWVAIAPPKGPKGLSGQGMNFSDIRIHAISARAAKAGKAEAIARLLEWMASPEGYYLLGFGVEGVNYTKDDNGFIKLDGIPKEKQYSDKSQQPLTQLRNLVFINTDVELDARYPVYKSANGKTMDAYGFRNKFAQFPWIEATASTVVTTPTNAADLKRFYDENIIKFALGQMPINSENWAAFMSGLEKLGVANLEAQAKKDIAAAGLAN